MRSILRMDLSGGDQSLSEDHSVDREYGVHPLLQQTEDDCQSDDEGDTSPRGIHEQSKRKLKSL